MSPSGSTAVSADMGGEPTDRSSSTVGQTNRRPRTHRRPAKMRRMDFDLMAPITTWSETAARARAVEQAGFSGMLYT